ncbi:MAG TPA: ankyrin repeat domain-containing protein [Candidatus Omnitrophota bacterium]|nr:ankyrin repeat domain-containing protein [Candidatus Omnitrophota bacterium]HPN66069.1 ankyrin repeat domain-containing protein [Candidatus Omnitrophota bacterium]
MKKFNVTMVIVFVALAASAMFAPALTAVQNKDSELCNAAMSGDIKKAEKFIRRGAFVNAKNCDGKTPLMLALENSHQYIAEMLIKKGANPNFADPGGTTPLMIAAQKGFVDIVKLLLSKGANPNTQQSNIKSVYSSENKTPIMFAAEGGNTDIVKMLIAKGADVNKKSRDGKTALKIAEEKGFSDVAGILKKAGAK